MLFTIFNDAVLKNGLGEFKYYTDNEDTNRVDDLVKYYTEKGFFNE